MPPLLASLTSVNALTHTLLLFIAIQPIQTRYKGYHFRSRLEARWAVFFDTAEIKWRYEPEGFNVNGRNYLPDFYLPDLDCYFEVKGTADYDIDFLQEFANEIRCNLVVAEGEIPDPDEWSCGETKGLQVLHRTKPEEWPDGVIDDVVFGYRDMFLRCNVCDEIKIMNEVYATMKDNCGACKSKHARWMPISDALEAARSARFEHEHRESSPKLVR